MGAAVESVKRRRKKNSTERGIALVAVLGILFLLTLLVASLVAISQTQRFTVATSTQLGDSVYREESAVNRTIWLLMNDRGTFSDRGLKTKSEQVLNRERFQADGIPHRFEVDGIPVEVTIRDMNAGVNASGYNPAAAFSYLEDRFARDAQLRQRAEAFRNRLMDYVDSDDLLRNDSLERADYEFRGWAPLPRNGTLQFREELLWIPGGESFIEPDENGELFDIVPIPPRGLRFAAGRPHFFSASLKLIQEKCDLTDNELEIVRERRNRIAAREINAEEAFSHDPLIWEKLKKQFSFSESSYYTLKAKLAPEAGLPGRTLSVSLQVGTSPGKPAIQFFDWNSL